MGPAKLAWRMPAYQYRTRIDCFEQGGVPASGRVDQGWTNWPQRAADVKWQSATRPPPAASEAGEETRRQVIADQSYPWCSLQQVLAPSLTRMCKDFLLCSFAAKLSLYSSGNLCRTAVQQRVWSFINFAARFVRAVTWSRGIVGVCYARADNCFFRRWVSSALVSMHRLLDTLPPLDNREVPH